MAHITQSVLIFHISPLNPGKFISQPEQPTSHGSSLNHNLSGSKPARSVSRSGKVFGYSITKKSEHFGSELGWHFKELFRMARRKTMENQPNLSTRESKHGANLTKHRAPFRAKSAQFFLLCRETAANCSHHANEARVPSPDKRFTDFAQERSST